MRITIKYLVKNEKENRTINIKPESFFDFDEDGFSIDSVHKYIFPYDYLDIKKEELTFVSLLIKDNLNYEKRDMFFWNDGKNETDYFIQSSFEKKEILEYMINSRIFINNNNEETEEQIVLKKNIDSIWVVTNHFFVNLNTGEQKNHIINNNQLDFIDGFRKMDNDSGT